MKTVSIKPVDVLFFRDSRPFTMHSEHYAKSMFPPMPQTVYGALRTCAMNAQNYDFEQFKNGNSVTTDGRPIPEGVKQELGTSRAPGSFSLKGPVLISENVPYYPVPADLKISERTNRRVLRYTVLSWFDWNENAGMMFDLPNQSSFPHIPRDKPLEDEDGWISQDNLGKYCRGDVDGITVRKNSEIYAHESRTGIGIDPGRNSVESGLMYTADFVRLKKGWELCVTVENISGLPVKGTLMLGGRNRFCDFVVENNRDLFAGLMENEHNIKQMVSQSGFFRWVLLTPAIFSGGWLPGGNTTVTLSNGVSFKILSAVIGRFGTVSGWDLAGRSAKPLKRVVPAGSVYYCQLNNRNYAEGLFEKLYCQNFSDEQAQFGYGLSLIGGLQ